MASRKRIPIDYTARDFSSIKQGLVDHAKRYYPNSFNDFSEAGFGSLMLDTVAYVGDIMSLYLDYQVNESFIETALEQENILKLGKQLGYKFTDAAASTGYVQIYVEIPADNNGQPDTDYLPIVKAGTKFNSDAESVYTLVDDVSFATDDADILVSKVDTTTNVPTHYAVKASGRVISGEELTEEISVGEFVEFYSTTLEASVQGEAITEIVKVEDSLGNEYFEVDALRQDIIYKNIVNKDTTTNKDVPNILKAVSVPRRFVADRASDGSITLRFGGGSETSNVNDEVSEPSNVVLQSTGREYISSTYFDPKVLAYNNKLGIAPSNTSLFVTYRVNPIDGGNAAVGAINGVFDINAEFDDEQSLDTIKVDNLITSIEVENEQPILGDASLPTNEELRQRIMGVYSAQNRAVTREDYVYLAYMMPAKYGSIFRAAAVRDADSRKRNLNMYVISTNTDGELTTASLALKENLKTWLSTKKMINDTIDILDAKVVNIGINFEVLIDDGVNKFQVLTECIDKLTDDLTERKFDIGESFSIIEVYKSLKEIDEVIDVTDVEITNKTGGVYTDLNFEIKNNMSRDGRVVVCPDNVIFEIKFPETDIKGTVK